MTYAIINLYNSNVGATYFPVWCPEEIPADVSLFTGQLGNPGTSMMLIMYANHPATPPSFTPGALANAYDFMCEDV